MVTIGLIILAPVMSIVTGFFTFKALQTGLKWNMQVNKGQEPTLEIKQPVKSAQQEEMTDMRDIINEYLNGAG